MRRLDFEGLSAQLLRQVRGKRSQTMANRRLGARSNLLYTWESGRRWPTAARFFVFARRMGIDVRAGLTRFYGRQPAWFGTHDPATAAGVAALLDDLRGNRSVAELARALGKTRSTVSRWLAGRTQPRLPEFLRSIEAASLRLLDFVAEFGDPAAMPALSARWRALEVSRRLAYDAPWAHAVLRALELSDYRRLPAHVPGWIAARLGISTTAEAEAVALLKRAGQIRMVKRRWQPSAVMTVDTSRDHRADLSLKAWAAQTGIARLIDSGIAPALRGGASGSAPALRGGAMSFPGDELFSFNLFTVSSADLERLRGLQRAYFRQLRAIVATSQPAEHVAIVNLQLFSLNAAPNPAVPKV